jgi:circadian clock protein KaiC
MDTWIVLRDGYSMGRQTRELYVLKSRGMAHSREHRELIVSGKGLELGPVPRAQTAATNAEGPDGVEAAE